MKKADEKNKGGRPKAEIDLNQLEAMCSMQCTDEEIAAMLMVSIDTIKRRKKDTDTTGFAQTYKRGKEKGKSSLRRLQWKAAQGITWIVWKCDKKQAYSTEKICEDQRAKRNSICGDCPGAREDVITDFKGGATGMQIWLGKQWLGQKDKSEVEASVGISLKDGLKKVSDHLKSHPEREKEALEALEDDE